MCHQYQLAFKNIEILMHACWMCIEESELMKVKTVTG